MVTLSSRTGPSLGESDGELKDSSSGNADGGDDCKEGALCWHYV